MAVDPPARGAGLYLIGVLPAVGFKFGGWVDIVLMQRALGSGATTAPSEIDAINTGEENG